MKKFTSILMAALFCSSMTTFAQDDDIKVSPAFNEDFEPTFTFNKEYKYYGIFLDDETKNANLTDAQYVYLGADSEAGRNLYVWENTFNFLTTSGTNSFGVPGGYLSLQVGNAGWSGLGYNINASTEYDLSGIDDDYTFHIAVSSTGKDPINFQLNDGTGHAANIVLGDKALDGNEPVANFDRDGEWYNIDIPMTYLEDNFGFSFKKDKAYKDNNIFVVLAGGNAGFTFNYDAVFFYGPSVSTGIKNITANKGSQAPTEYYTTDGKKVTKAQAKAVKGIYLVKENGKTKKVVNN